MPRSNTSNLHVPLPEHVYMRLRAESSRSGRPATEIAREAIDQWLIEAQRRHMHEEIAAYAVQAGGTPDDIDADLEAAASEHLAEEAKREGFVPRSLTRSTTSASHSTKAATPRMLPPCSGER